jgi:hypothetical protein
MVEPLPPSSHLTTFEAAAAESLKIVVQKVIDLLKDHFFVSGRRVATTTTAAGSFRRH